MKRFFIGLFAVATSFLAVTYFLACLTPLISPVKFWPMSFLALGFPYLALVVLVLAFLWLFIQKKMAVFLIFLFFGGFKNLSLTFACNLFTNPTIAKNRNFLRIVSWNVRGFDDPSIISDSTNIVRTQMFAYLEKVDADVLCLQEFSEHEYGKRVSSTEALRKMGYLYSFKATDNPHYFPSGIILNGTSIFSKIALENQNEVMLGDTSLREYIAFADIIFKNRKIRIFGAHFKSINLFAQPADSLNRVPFYGDSKFVYTASRFEKLKAFGQAHTKEALIAKQAVLQSPNPVIIGTDMNSVPTSFAYHTLSAGLQDAFVMKGWGLGTTLDSLPKTLRIDFLLVDKQLEIKNFKKEVLHLSDHFPQMVDVDWK